MATRCKVECLSVTKRKWNKEFVYEAEFGPIYQGSPENEEFFKATPIIVMKIGTIKDDHFVPGKKYFVDFTECE